MVGRPTSWGVSKDHREPLLEILTSLVAASSRQHEARAQVYHRWHDALCHGAASKAALGRHILHMKGGNWVVWHAVVT